MIFSIEVRPALHGDCLMVHYGSKDDPGLVLIDGGPSQVYRPHLKPRLTDIRGKRGLGTDEPLWIDLLMVSHIDEDHIVGILELTDELATAYEAKKPLPLKIRSCWHNVFEDLIAAKTSEKLLSAVTASFGAAALSGEADTEGLDPDVAKILASVTQGLQLRDYIVRLAWQNRINPEFEGKPVMAKEDGKTINMKKGGLQLTVVGPMQPELRRLQKAYDKFLKEHPEKKKATAALAAFTKDNSIPNLSSIVVLAEVGDKRMLLTGDARGDKILQGLQLTGRLGPDKASTFHVDVLKAPHHGSARNLEPDFFERITAKHYVFSGNGDYGNPERETLEMLWKARGDADYTIHLTYLITDIDAMRQKDWLKEQNKERRNNKPVRPDWSPAQHSLTAFFDAHETFKNKVSIVEKDKPHVINLLDEVGF